MRRIFSAKVYLVLSGIFIVSWLIALGIIYNDNHPSYYTWGIMWAKIPLAYLIFSMVFALLISLTHAKVKETNSLINHKNLLKSLTAISMVLGGVASYTAVLFGTYATDSLNFLWVIFACVAISGLFAACYAYVARSK